MSIQAIFQVHKESNDFRLMRRLNLINFFFIIEIGVFTVFAFLNFFKLQDYTIALFDLISGLVFMTAFIDLRINKIFNRSKWIATVSLLTFLVIFTQINQNESFGLIWCVIAPLVIISIHGYKEGVYISIAYFFILFMMGLLGIGEWQNGTWDMVSLIRFSVAIIITIAVTFLSERSIEKFQNSLQEISMTDYLTKLYNRRKVDEIFEQQIQKVQTQGNPLAIILLDVDLFKEINDRYGHLEGDRVLVELAGFLKQEIHKSDFIGRWGGEEFIIINPNTDEEEAFHFAERLRKGIKEEKFGQIEQLTCSFGVCEYSALNDSMQKMLTCADRALYRAKKEGRDRVCCPDMKDQ